MMYQPWPPMSNVPELIYLPLPSAFVLEYPSILRTCDPSTASAMMDDMVWLFCTIPLACLRLKHRLQKDWSTGAALLIVIAIASRRCQAFMGAWHKLASYVTRRVLISRAGTDRGDAVLALKAIEAPASNLNPTEDASCTEDEKLCFGFVARLTMSRRLAL